MGPTRPHAARDKYFSGAGDRYRRADNATARKTDCVQRDGAGGISVCLRWRRKRRRHCAEIIPSINAKFHGSSFLVASSDSRCYEDASRKLWNLA